MCVCVYIYIYIYIYTYESLPLQESTISAGVQMEGMQAMYTFCVAVMLGLTLLRSLLSTARPSPPG